MFLTNFIPVLEIFLSKNQPVPAAYPYSTIYGNPSRSPIGSPGGTLDHSRYYKWEDNWED